MDKQNAPLLAIKNMRISYLRKSGDEKVIVENGSFEVNRGEVVIIIGENGSGKSSVFQSLVRDPRKMDTTKKDSRDLYFKGEKLTDDKIDEFRRCIGYAPQEDDLDGLFHPKVWDAVLHSAYLSGKYKNSELKEMENECNKVFEALNCNTYADGEFKKRKISVCSGGEKRMATLLSALCRTRSDLFILDEPLNNLDAEHARILNNYLVALTTNLENKEELPGVLIITHCHMFRKHDRVYKLSGGEISDFLNYEAKSCYGNCISQCGLYYEENK